MPGVTGTTTYPSLKIPTNTKAVTNVARSALGIVTVTIASHTYKVGDVLIGKSFSTNTWLNGQRMVVVSVPDSTHLTLLYRGFNNQVPVSAGADTGNLYLSGTVVLPDGRVYERTDADITVPMTLEQYELVDPKLITSGYFVDATP